MHPTLALELWLWPSWVFWQWLELHITLLAMHIDLWLFIFNSRFWLWIEILGYHIESLWEDFKEDYDDWWHDYDDVDWWYAPQGDYDVIDDYSIWDDYC